MPAPVLSHWRGLAGSPAATATGPVLSAGRAMAVGRLTIANYGTIPTDVQYYVGPTAEAGSVLSAMTLQPAELFSDSGIVVPAGERIWVSKSDASASIAVNAFGQEVDSAATGTLYRHDRAVLPAAVSVWETVLPAPIATGRAYVVSKLVVTNTSLATANLLLLVAPSVTSSGYLFANLPMEPGQSFVESGLVLPAGENFYLRSPSTGSFTVNVFGQEVANG